MFSHEYFKELSALAAIGQLTSDEERELNVHLGECESCREIHFDYARVIQHHLPLSDAIRWRIKSSLPPVGPDSEIRDRFLARARAEGIDLSTEADQQRVLISSPSWWTLFRRSAAIVATVAVIAMPIIKLSQWYQVVPRSRETMLDTTLKHLVRQKNVLESELSTLYKNIGQQTARLESMRQRELESEKAQQQMQWDRDQARQRAESLSSALQQVMFEKNSWANLIRQKDATIAGLQGKVDSIQHEKVDLLTSRPLLEGEILDLKEALRQATTSLEREQQLSAVSNDVRKLMGARNLHIMDVHDVGGGRKAAKAFGRVFYAEGQSLIFYAFDLPSGGLSPAKYSFQAWGQREWGPQVVRNLGTFEVDDHEQRRWVLKVNDPALLAGIDSVFVTAESFRDVKEPRGKKLLYAYIVGQPNHP